MYLADTIVAPATPPGRGAVAIVRLSGPRAFEVMRAIWHPRGCGSPAPRRLCLGDIIDPETGARIDRALGVIMPRPRSLTGEDVAELQCHGGAYLVRRVVALAGSQGARIAEPGEFSRRAFLNGRIDLTEAEAVADLVDARSQRGLEQALLHLDGALKKKVSSMRSKVLSIRAHLEAEIDFADEDIGLPPRREIVESLGSLQADVALLEQSFARGRITREGVRAAIVGKPNAGKSSVLNLLLGVDRAIVSEIPGTTRDVIEDSILIGPYLLVLQDTAGVRDSSDPVERIGIDRAQRRSAEAELLIAVFDSSRPLEAEDEMVAAIAARRPGLALLNKRDLEAAIRFEDLRAIGVTTPILPLCALRAEDAPVLREELAHAIEGLAPPDAESSVTISRERHRHALCVARAHLDTAAKSLRSRMPPEIIAVDVNLAADSLGSITGEITGEDVLDRIFREFCIGK